MAGKKFDFTLEDSMDLHCTFRFLQNLRLCGGRRRGSKKLPKNLYCDFRVRCFLLMSISSEVVFDFENTGFPVVVFSSFTCPTLSCKRSVHRLFPEYRLCILLENVQSVLICSLQFLPVSWSCLWRDFWIKILVSGWCTFLRGVVGVPSRAVLVFCGEVWAILPILVSV